MFWLQREWTFPTPKAGFYPITREIIAALPEIKTLQIGLLHLFLRHTSAGLTINENADPDVLTDLGHGLDRIAPESGFYRHTVEGKDDMPAHIKSSLLGASLTIPIGQGRLLLGTWQDVYLCEHRGLPHRRTIILTLTGRPE